jgi:hypothetical protein
MKPNPYEPPQHVKNGQRRRLFERDAIRAAIQLLAKLAFWFGVAVAVLGLPITFVPGGEKEWFGCASVFVLAGLLVPRLGYRISAVVLFFFLLVQAISGHYRGIEYQRQLREQRAKIKSVEQSPSGSTEMNINLGK